VRRLEAFLVFLVDRESAFKSEVSKAQLLAHVMELFAGVPAELRLSRVERPKYKQREAFFESAFFLRDNAAVDQDHMSDEIHNCQHARACDEADVNTVVLNLQARTHRSFDVEDVSFHRHHIRVRFGRDLMHFCRQTTRLRVALDCQVLVAADGIVDQVQQKVCLFVDQEIVKEAV